MSSPATVLPATGDVAEAAALDPAPAPQAPLDDLHLLRTLVAALGGAPGPDDVGFAPIDVPAPDRVAQDEGRAGSDLGPRMTLTPTAEAVVAAGLDATLCALDDRQLAELAALLTPTRRACAIDLDVLRNFLYVAAAACGALARDRAPVDLAGVAVEAADAALAAAQRGGLTLAVHGTRVWLDADRESLARVVGNLVGNAIAYTPPGGHVDVRVAADGADAVLVVADTGPGLPPDATTRLFTPYGRFHPALGVPGAGLGLCATRAIVEAHGGTIAVHSAPAHGSVFTIRIPQRA